MTTSNDEIEGTFAGQTVKFRGRETIYIAVLCLALAASMWLLYNATTQAIAVIDKQTEVMSDQHSSLSTEQRNNSAVLKEMSAALNEQNWIITQTDEQRKRLNLEMPDTLRAKIRRRD